MNARSMVGQGPAVAKYDGPMVGQWMAMAGPMGGPSVTIAGRGGAPHTLLTILRR